MPKKEGARAKERTFIEELGDSASIPRHREEAVRRPVSGEAGSRGTLQEAPRGAAQNLPEGHVLPESDGA